MTDETLQWAITELALRADEDVNCWCSDDLNRVKSERSRRRRKFGLSRTQVKYWLIAAERHVAKVAA